MASSNANTWASHLFANGTSAMVTTGISDKAIAIATMAMQQSDESKTTSAVWYRCDVQLQKDRDVAISAVKAGCLPANLQEWPTELKHDSGFWNSLLSYQGSAGYDGRQASRNDTKLTSSSRCVPKWKSESQIRSVLHRLPGLGRNVNFWYTVLHSNFVSSDLLIDKSHPTILSNKQFMVHAIQNDYTVYDALCAPLNQDEDIVVAALLQHPNAIIYIPAFVQELYPDAVARSISDCIENFPKRCKQRQNQNAVRSLRRFDFADYLSARLWRNREVVMSWVSKGGRYRDEDFPAELANDEELFLLLAQHHPFDFEHASFKLRSDKEFMKKAIAIDGSLLLEAVGCLKYDFDLAVISYSSMGTDAIRMLEEERSYNYFVNFHSFLTQKKEQYDSFFLFAMAVSIVHPHKYSSSKHLTLLNQGSETTNTTLKLIHEYIGLPKGIDVQRVRIAHKIVLKQLRDFTD